jgi:hypothetical protein
MDQSQASGTTTRLFLFLTPVIELSYYGFKLLTPSYFFSSHGNIPFHHWLGWLDCPDHHNLANRRPALAILLPVRFSSDGNSITHHSIPQPPISQHATTYSSSDCSPSIMVCYLWIHISLAADRPCAQPHSGCSIGNWLRIDRVFIKVKREKPVEAISWRWVDSISFRHH